MENEIAEDFVPPPIGGWAKQKKGEMGEKGSSTPAPRKIV